jgi:acyl-CoA synthetase (AMP-forming)/AMP-acid ligase II
MIISGGENIYPAEVENALMSHPDIDDVAVIGVPSEKWGETVKAIVVVRAGSDPSESDIITYARSKIAHYKCPTSVDRIEVLPRNPSGKILKTELRIPYWGDKTRAVN